ncbi:MAG: hypothetical protein E7Z91_00475 [Cyanobacteria bacterium SIG30]|nr:hypothetical protein [Cyanobacteria bacterium SIG30]
MNLGSVTKSMAPIIGVGTGVGALALTSKVTKKPVGINGSIAHILTNDKLDKEAKKDVFKETAKEEAKDLLTATGTTLATGGLAALLAKKSNKFVGGLKNIKTEVGKGLSQISVKGKNLKDILANTKIYTKIKTLPTPVKAGIMVGAAVLGFFGLKDLTENKAAYIEGKHESK